MLPLETLSISVWGSRRLAHWVFVTVVSWWLFSTWAHTLEQGLAGNHVDPLKSTFIDRYEVHSWTHSSRTCRTHGSHS